MQDKSIERKPEPKVNIPITDLMKAITHFRFMAGQFNPKPAQRHQSRMEAIQGKAAKGRESAKLSRASSAARRLERGWN